MPKVSIIVPVYNSELYVHQCLDSLVNQTFCNIEIICINDGSTDNSLTILNAYAESDRRVRVFSKENEGKGAASARNMGLDNAYGEYILFLDSDDFFELDMIELLVKRAEEANADVVIYKANRFDNALQRITGPYVSIELQHAPAKNPFSYKDCPDRIFQVGDLIAWNKIYRKDLLDRYFLRFEPIAISDDQYVPALALVFAKRITYVDKAFVNYRFNTGTSQVDFQSKHPEAAYRATYSIVAEMRKHGIYEKVKRSYLNMAMRLMREYYDKMTEYSTMEFLYNKYLNEVFLMLDAESLSEDFFYDNRIWQWYRLISSNSLVEILFKAARAYGSDMTTAVLRFQFPYEQISRGSRIVLIGKGIIGRHWYAQIILSNYCDVVYWADNEQDIPDNIKFDKLLFAN